MKHMWKCYRVFMKKSDRLQIYLIFPLAFACIYAMLLWWAPIFRNGEYQVFLEGNLKWQTAISNQIFRTFLPSVAFWLAEAGSLGELFEREDGKLDLLRLSCKGKQVYLRAVKMDLVLRAWTLALLYGGMVVAELAVGALCHFQLRSMARAGYFFLEEVTICYFAVTLAVTLGRLFPGYIRRFMFFIFSAYLARVIKFLADFVPMVVLAVALADGLLAWANVCLAESRWSRETVAIADSIQRRSGR